MKSKRGISFLGLLAALTLAVGVKGAPAGDQVSVHYRVQAAVKALESGDLGGVDSLMKPLDYEQVTTLSEKWAAYGLKMLAVAAYYQESFKLSNAYYSLLLKNPYSQKDRELRADCHNNRGINYEMLGLLDSAYHNYRRSLAFEQKRGDSLGLAQSWVNLSLLAGKLGYYEESQAYGDRARAYFTREGQPAWHSLAARNLGLVEMWRGRYDTALVFFREARRLDLRRGDTLAVYRVETNMANALLEKGQYEKAQALLDRATLRFEAQRHRKATLVRNLARVDLALARENFGLARTLTEESLLPYLEKIKQLGLYEQLLMLRMQLAGGVGQHRKMRSLSDALAAYQREQRRSQTRVIWREQKLQEAIEKGGSGYVSRDPQGGHFKGIPLNWWGPLLFGLIIGGIAFWRYGRRMSWWRRPTKIGHSSFKSPRREGTGESTEAYNTVLYERLERYMAQEERFRDPECNLSLVARELGTNVSYLSRAVNQGSGTNFRGYLNKWRIETAKKELINLDGSQTVAEVGYNVGYKSPSVFTRVFKEAVGLPPKAFSRPLAGH